MLKYLSWICLNTYCYHFWIRNFILIFFLQSQYEYFYLHVYKQVFALVTYWVTMTNINFGWQPAIEQKNCLEKYKIIFLKTCHYYYCKTHVIAYFNANDNCWCWSLVFHSVVVFWMFTNVDNWEINRKINREKMYALLTMIDIRFS